MTFPNRKPSDEDEGQGGPAGVVRPHATPRPLDEADRRGLAAIAKCGAAATFKPLPKGVSLIMAADLKKRDLIDVMHSAKGETLVKLLPEALHAMVAAPGKAPSL